MSNTTNYGWNIPDNTDLVKDGALAIRTLGNAIDTSLVDLRGGTTGQVLRKQSNTQMDFEWGSAGGLVLINTTSFTGVSSVSLPASTFSATYDNYRVVMNVDSSAASVGFNVRMRAAGTDNTSSNYIWVRYGQTQGGYSGPVAGGSLVTAIGITAISGTYTTSSLLDFLMPFNSSYNTNIQFAGGYFDSTSNYLAQSGFGFTSVTTSYDSATFYPDSGTISGVVSVYGLAK